MLSVYLLNCCSHTSKTFNHSFKGSASNGYSFRSYSVSR